jgi:deazaflavin-dependent oxidoreductase (nitroreductase family)
MSRIDRPPGKLMRLVFRAPILVYRSGLGWLMGKRLLMLTHTGRKSGQLRYAVLEIARHDEPSGVLLVPAAYGRRADWYLNILKTPEVVVNCRGRRLEVVAETLTIDAAADEFAVYAASHPRAAKNLGQMMGISFEDPGAVAEKIPLVGLRPR